MLEQQYLSRHRERSDPAEHKHYYTAALFNNPTPAWTFNGQENYYQLCSPGIGTAVNQRLTNAAEVIGSRIRICFSITPTGAAFTQPPLYPTITLMIIRDKLPITPGTLPPMYANDANPPTGLTNVFGRLAQSQTPPMDRVAVLNPNSACRYHIYKIEHYDTYEWLKDALSISTTDPTVASVPRRLVNKEFYIPLHGIRHQWNSVTAVSSIINPVYVMLRVDLANNVADANNGFYINYMFTADTEFRDLQD